MKSSTSFGFSSSLLFFFIVAASFSVVYSEDAASNDVNYETSRTCSYELIVQTGDGANDGTESRISVTLGNSAGKRVEIPDLKKLGTMRPGHGYFEHGNADNFRVDEADCFPAAAPLCNITVTSDGSGQKPGWFLGEVDVSQNYLSITMSEGAEADQEPEITPTRINFNFGQWLAKDEPPYKLTATVNKCK